MRKASLLLAGAAAAALWRRRSRTPAERVDLYFADGSMISFAGNSPEGERLMPLAEELLAASER